MKKLITLLMSLAMALSLTSCLGIINSKQPDVEASDNIIDNIEEEIPEETEINAAVFWYNYSDNFLSTVREALNTELDAAGIKYNNYDAQSNQDFQDLQIDTAIASGANLLIVNIVEMADDVAQSIVDKAEAAEIPIIFFNREVSDNVINSYENACFVGTRPEEAGEKQGQMAGKYIIENYDRVDRNGDGVISYIMMKGQFGNFNYLTPCAIEFCNAELEAAGKPALSYYDPNNLDMCQLTNWMKDLAFNEMSIALGTNPMDGDAPIEVVFANNDDAAIGCIEALNAVDFNYGDGDSIPVFGVDYTPEARAAIEAGKMTGSILQSADAIAETIAALVENVINGEHVFDSAVDVFNVDESTNKIRVPYEIKIK